MTLENIVRGLKVLPVAAVMLAESVFPGTVYEQKWTPHGDTTIVWNTQRTQGGVLYTNQGTGESYTIHDNGVVDNIHGKNGNLTKTSGHSTSGSMRTQHRSDRTNSQGHFYGNDKENKDISDLTAQQHFEKGESFYNNKQYELAKNEFEMAVEKNKNNSDYYNRLGDAQKHLRDYKGAIEKYKICINLNSTDGNAFGNLGYCFYKLNDKEKAMEFWEKGSKLGDLDSKRSLKIVR